MGNWDITTPLGTDFISAGDDQIRNDKTAIQEALRGGAAEGTEAVFPGAAPTTDPIFRYRGLKGTTGARPAFGQYGLYANTTLNTLQRDSGSAWEDVATLIPSGTKMVFYQASAPTGWTAVAVNDKFLRVVTAGGTGGTTGGTVAASTSLAHTHTVASHTHTESAHTHTISSDGAHTHTLVGGAQITSGSGETWSATTTSNGAHTHTGATGSGGSGSTGAATPATDSQLGIFAYADIVIATKD